MLSGTASRFLWLTDFPTFQDNYSISHSPLMTSLLISLKKKKKSPAENPIVLLPPLSPCALSRVRPPAVG